MRFTDDERALRSDCGSIPVRPDPVTRSTAPSSAAFTDDGERARWVETHRRRQRRKVAQKAKTPVLGVKERV
jgi:hypothetical protein